MVVLDTPRSLKVNIHGYIYVISKLTKKCNGKIFLVTVLKTDPFHKMI